MNNDLPELSPIVAIVRAAGTVILAHYHPGVAVAYKPDRSPLTLADRAAHDVIADRLAALHPDIPLLSEEGQHADYATRRHWPRYWLVDPLDGTREFIAQNGEFTVNVALIQAGVPVLGVLYAPVPDLLYAASPATGAFRQVGLEPPVAIATRGRRAGLVAVGSRTHAHPAEDAHLTALPIAERLAVGSSLKFGYLAEGLADYYYRHNPTMEWDTAAGHAILSAAGGSVTDAAGQPLRYNKPDLRNGPFVARGWPVEPD